MSDEPSNGHIVWHNWALDYGIFNHEGLCLINGYFEGQHVFNKLSLPVIRVKYVDDDCGPFNDRIHWDPWNLGEDFNIGGPHHLWKVVCPGGDRYICVEEITDDGVPCLRISIYARIGAYHIGQTYRLRDDGIVKPRVSSKGLSCNTDHWHHPYWRFDLSLGSPQIHRASVFSKGGVKITDLTVEGALRNAVFGQDIEYRIVSTQPPDIGQIQRPAMVTITPPSLNDNLGIVGPTSFSSIDGYLRIYRGSEDIDWPFRPKDEMMFSTHKNCIDQDLVFWYVGHLLHHADQGEDHWHVVGPDLHFVPMIIADIPAEAKRRVRIGGNMKVKDFGVVEDNFASSPPFSEDLLVDPSMRARELVQRLVINDVTAELIIRAEWQKDFSVDIEFTANLYDELERVAQWVGGFNVPRDSKGRGSAHLVDHHGGDPDTGDIEFTVANEPQ